MPFFVGVLLFFLLACSIYAILAGKDLSTFVRKLGLYMLELGDLVIRLAGLYLILNAILSSHIAGK